MLSQLYNWILMKPILSYGSLLSQFKFIYFDRPIYKDLIGSLFTYVYKGVLVLMQGYIGIIGQLSNPNVRWVQVT